jgi:hypothetical protein
MGASPVRNLAVKNLEKMSSFIAELQGAVAQASDRNPQADNGDVARLVGVLGDVVGALVEELQRSGGSGGSFLASRGLAVMGVHLGGASVSLEGDGNRQRIINELCLKQADQYRLRALRLEGEIRGLQVDLREIKSLLEVR